MFEPDPASVRFIALGDSATHGVGDLVDGSWRGWARLLAAAMAERYDVRFDNLAVSGATVADVRQLQLEAALAHRPQVASLIVGLNDTLRSSWDSQRVHDDLLHCAETLAGQGATLLTVRFHDHSMVFGLPKLLARPMARRIGVLNAAYDEIHAKYGGLRIDLAEQAEVHNRSFWSVDRLHPSELGHRILAREYAALLSRHGLPCPLPSPFCTGQAPTRLRDARWLVTEGGPWLGRRARDLGPWAARLAVSEVFARTATRRAVASPQGVRPIAA